MRGPFAKYYEPYAEYCLRTTLSAAELAAALDKECPASLWSILGIKGARRIGIGFFLRSKTPLTLRPVSYWNYNRNTLNGDVRIRCEESSDGSETILHIEIAPSKGFAWFPYLYCSFALFWGIAVACAGLWWGPLIAAAFIGFCFLVLEICRSVAAENIPRIREEFEILLRKLEDKYPPAHEGRREMKIVKTLLAMLAAALILPVSAAEPVEDVRKPESEVAGKRGGDSCPHQPKCDDDKDFNQGLIPGYKFTPLQLAIGVGKTKLFDADADTVFSFGLLILTQKSAVLSLAPLNFLTNNYGIQIGVPGTLARNNYGISLGVVNVHRKNYGLQIGALLNESNHTGQICGVNIADKVQIAIANVGPGERGIKKYHEVPEPLYFQLGVFNRGDSAVQIGVLNYNLRSHVPLLPLVNFAMKPDGGK